MRFAVTVLLALFAAQVHAAEDVNSVPIAFENAGVKLEGTLHLPKSKPIAAAVLIHGSGPTGRMSGLARLLADEGIATLTYDKRGVGRSGGQYEGTDNVSARNLALLADDAAAAFVALTREERLAGVPAGYLGLSQAGWIAPVAAAKSPDVRFMGLWSGPVATTSEEIHFSALARKNQTQGHDHDHAQPPSRAELERFVASVPRRADDVDPRLSIAKLDIPSLWLFGGDDTSIPVALSVRRLLDLMTVGQTNLSYQVFEHEEHNLVDRPTQPAFPAMVAWVKAVAAGP
jgi:pimeloyl-ACP methyl ester carboxylesterase